MVTPLKVLDHLVSRRWLINIQNFLARGQGQCQGGVEEGSVKFLSVIWLGKAQENVGISRALKLNK
jgi:hypothetical protein